MWVRFDSLGRVIPDLPTVPEVETLIQDIMTNLPKERENLEEQYDLSRS